jgi:hypothetical protein
MEEKTCESGHRLKFSISQQGSCIWSLLISDDSQLSALPKLNSTFPECKHVILPIAKPELAINRTADIKKLNIIRRIFNTTNLLLKAAKSQEINKAFD